jgi:putative flippase GtrA
MDEWLLRYLIVGVIGATAALALLFGLTIGNSMSAAGISAVVLLIVSVVIVRDLQSYRAA